MSVMTRKPFKQNLTFLSASLFTVLQKFNQIKLLIT